MSKGTRFTAVWLWKNSIGLAAVLVLIGTAAVAILAPVVAPYAPTFGDPANRLLPPLSAGHLLGSDALGQDVLSRIIWGSRVSLLVGFISVPLAAVIGSAIGMASGYFGGWFDAMLIRIIDMQLSIPFVILALTIAGVLGPSLTNIIITLVLSSWVIYARVMRAEVIAHRQRQYVEAAHALGMSHWRIIFRHIARNVLPTLMVLGSLEVGRMIITEASISFLGYGVQPPTPSWGNMIADGRDYLLTVWWLPTLPGVALAFLSLATNLAGDWLRDVLDVRLK